MDQPPPPPIPQPPPPPDRPNPMRPDPLMPPPPPPPPVAPDAERRARWGMGDVLLGIVFVLVVAIVGVVIGTAFQAIIGGADLATDPEILTDSAWVVVFGAVFQQLAMAGWPAIVSRWKGEDVATDWGWRFKLSDLPIGVGVAASSLIAAAVTAAALAVSLDVDVDEIEGNTDFLTDGDPSLWFIAAMIGITVVGAPISEELFFRGLTLRAVEKRLGLIAGILASSILFTVIHYIGGSSAQTAILFASVGVRGLIFALATVVTGRLGSAIIAHALSNLLVVIIALSVA